jgi:hypothetical protein
VQFDEPATSPPQTRKHPLRIEMRVSPGDALSPDKSQRDGLALIA